VVVFAFVFAGIDTTEDNTCVVMVESSSAVVAKDMVPFNLFLFASTTGVLGEEVVSIRMKEFHKNA
jgi:hypothetical protein